MAALMITACGPALAQAAPPPRPPMQKAFHMHFGRWWDKPEMAKKLSLTSEQQKKMDAIFASYRPRLESLHGNLHRQEAILGPLIGADNPNEGQILTQIDVVAQARANLEKEFARMLLGLQRQLTHEQWEKLRELHREHMERMKHRDWHGGPQGPHGPKGPPPPQM
jgi:Spy/CpxP family protein refolding chaperone